MTEELKGEVISMNIVTSEYAIGYESGYEIGYKIGYAKGAHEEKIRAAKNFFALDFTVEDVRKMYPDLNIQLLDYLRTLPRILPYLYGR